MLVTCVFRWYSGLFDTGCNRAYPFSYIEQIFSEIVQ
uniref:Uncharacterized protein n=1 Tax=Siphoviridae sp. ctu1h4 TaxID=2826499 RepID=A0A8S5MXB4_9CAUD|nr:MAG TPA: hypothetical protein [Siphoviridae sp. ctu1h4]